jgi:hypothetical protein
MRSFMTQKLHFCNTVSNQFQAIYTVLYLFLHNYMGASEMKLSKLYSPIFAVLLGSFSLSSLAQPLQPLSNDIPDDVGLAQAVGYQIAMMDDMNEMSDKPMSQKGMNKMQDNNMQGNMPAESAEDCMSSPCGKNMMGRMKPPQEPGDISTGLPGFTGAPHLYHVGAVDFFLDLTEQANFSSAQQERLADIKEKATLEASRFDGRIESAEQELWKLTSAASPSITKIESKVRAIEKLRGDKRIAFIRAVGSAAKILTPDQRKAILNASAMPSDNAQTQDVPPGTKSDGMKSMKQPMRMH